LSAHIVELEKLLASIIAEHRVLSDAIQAHQDAMRTFKVDALAVAQQAIESSRTRLLSFEARRRVTVQQIARVHRLPADPSLAQIADVAPPVSRKNLMKLRDDLRAITEQVARKTTVSSKVAGSLLGHLNTVVRVVAGAVQQAAVYTKQGMPTVSARIGVMEAVA
jgi:hypothetical protein